MPLQHPRDVSRQSRCLAIQHGNGVVKVTLGALVAVADADGAELAEFRERANEVKNHALLRGGIGSDPEVVELYESYRRLVTDRVLRVNQALGDEGILRIAIRGWIGFARRPLPLRSLSLSAQ